MKAIKRLLHKWQSGFVATPIMAFGSVIALFGIQYDRFWGAFVLGTLLFGMVYIILGAPLSMLIDWMIAGLPIRSRWISRLLHVLIYSLGGFATSMIFFAIADREHLTCEGDR